MSDGTYGPCLRATASGRPIGESATGRPHHPLIHTVLRASTIDPTLIGQSRSSRVVPMKTSRHSRAAARHRLHMYVGTYVYTCISMCNRNGASVVGAFAESPSLQLQVCKSRLLPVAASVKCLLFCHRCVNRSFDGRGQSPLCQRI